MENGRERCQGPTVLQMLTTVYSFALQISHKLPDMEIKTSDNMLNKCLHPGVDGSCCVIHMQEIRGSILATRADYSGS